MTIDILLANPLFLSQNEAERELMTPYFPLGLLYLASYLRDRDFSVEIFDGTFAEDEKAFLEALERHRPRVVGLTALQPTREAALALAHVAQAFSATVLLGGPDPTRHPETYLADPAVDIVVHHEGEETLVELLGTLGQENEAKPDLYAILGLAFRDENGDVVITPPRPYIADLDDLSPPARDLIDVEAYRRAWRGHHGHFSLSIIATRGCPYGCKWCQKSVFGRSFRPRAPEAVAEEMRSIKKEYQPDKEKLGGKQSARCY